MSSGSDQDDHAVGKDSADQPLPRFPTARHPMAEVSIELGFGLASYGIEQSGAEVGRAMERCAGKDLEGGYRVDLYGLPCAMEAEGRAEPGIYARLVAVDELGRSDEGSEHLVLEKMSDGIWTVYPQEKHPDTDDARSGVSAFAERTTALLGTIEPSSCRFRIKLANRMVAADVHRGLAIWEESYDPAKRHEKVSPSNYDRPAF